MWSRSGSYPPNTSGGFLFGFMAFLSLVFLLLLTSFTCRFLSHQEEDVDFLAKFSRLVNGMGQSLVLSWTKLVKSGNGEEAAETLAALEAKVPLLLQLLVHEDDDISANVVGFCYEYLHVLKQVSSTSTDPGLGGRGGVTGTGVSAQ